MTNRDDIQRTFDPDLPVFILRAQLDDPSTGRAVERLLADLWAIGVIEVLDGRLLDWPPVSAVWQHRAPYNVPRLAPLPVTVWDPVLGSSQTPQPGRALARLIPDFGPGMSAICAVCSTSNPDRVRQALTPPGTGLVAPSLDITTISGRRYERFRQRAMSRNSSIAIRRGPGADRTRTPH